MSKFNPLSLTIAVAISSLSIFGQSGPQVQLPPEYKKWLTEDVRYIIASQERKEFMRLTSDKDRDRFIVAFWARRNPNPEGKENAFKQEHYRRLAFANEHFAAGTAGWKTDRGRIYIVYGPPDSIDTRAANLAGPSEESWLYHHMKGGGDEVRLKFVDNCRCGEYHLETPLPNNLWDMQ